MKNIETKILQLIVRLILMIPNFISILLIFYTLFVGGNKLVDLDDIIWTGYVDYLGNGGGGNTSDYPIYCGLMAVAVADLIKDNQVKM